MRDFESKMFARLFVKMTNGVLLQLSPTAFFFLLLISCGKTDEAFRPPAVPLIVSDPFLSMWSRSDNAYDSFPTHWAGAVMPIVLMVRVDGAAYRLIGSDTFSGSCGTTSGVYVNAPSDEVQAAQQTSVEVFPLTTIYQFRAGSVAVNVSFMTTAVPDDIELFSRGTSYITFSTISTDGKAHTVQIYYENTAEIVVNNDDTTVQWLRNSTADGKAMTMRIGTVEQNILGEKGDGRRISWGFFYVAIRKEDNLQTSMTAFFRAACAFVSGKPLPVDDTGTRPCNIDWPVLSAVWDLGKVQSQVVSRHMVVFLDDIYSIDYFSLKLPPMWRHTYNNDPLRLASQALDDYVMLVQKIDSYNNKLMSDLEAAGGWRYAAVSALVYRQVFGAMKVVWNPQQNMAWAFMMEMSTDGDVSTIDVIYPASSQLIYTNPELLRLTLLPLLAYSNNETTIKYNLAWAPHHLGTWPICDLTPDRQEQMPVEESANMLLMLAAIAQRQENNITYLLPFNDGILRSWADFIVSALPTPPMQLCTDDFEGPEANNTNLVVKGILSLEAYAILLDMMKNSSGADYYRAQSKAFLDFWLTNALEGSGPMKHYRREYQLDGSFSLKYNLLYQLILNISIFPTSVFEAELVYYLSQKNNTYGIPLNDRASFTLTEYQGGLIGLAAAYPDYSKELIDQLFLFANNTASRVPLNDRYNTNTGAGLSNSSFIARSTVGELFSLLLVKSGH